MAGAIRQLEERQFPTDVVTMEWSPKMDLLAVVNRKGEIALHRLTWQRVWLLSPPDEFDTTVILAWRPDGKLLGVCYEMSKVTYLVDVENKNVIHKITLTNYDDLVVCMRWLTLPNTERAGALMNDKTNLSPTGDYLPSLPNLNRSFGQESERKEFLSHNLDILFIGQDDGSILMYIFGMFYCGTIKVGCGPITQIIGGSNGSLWIMWDHDNCINISKAACPLFEKNTAFSKVVHIQANIECLKDYLSRTLMATSEAWETILLEMDEKLTRYAEANPPGGIAADFLELLMIGIPTKSVENFLLRELTEKGLKKFGHSIEMCYSNIQKLVSKNLNSVCMALVYQLAELRGLVRVGGSYELLGLRDENLVTTAIIECEAFLAKLSEIEQVIDQSMRNYKAFFRWLYVAILQLTDERVPSEVSRVSQQELTFIAEFLHGFDKIVPGTDGRRVVNLEKLGQYLRHENLQTCLTPEGSEWAAMLDSNHCLHDYAHLVKQDFNLSLLQSHGKLDITIQNVFKEAYQGLVDQFSMTSIALPLSTKLTTAQVTINDGNLLLAVGDTSRKILNIFKMECLSTKPVTLSSKIVTINMIHEQGAYPKECTDIVIADLQFYSQEYLSLLLSHKQTRASFLIQIPLRETHISECQDEHRINLVDIIGATWPKPLQGIFARRLAVSGVRKVAAILSENNRKIRLLETEVEPEDEDEDDDDDDGIQDNMMDAIPSTSVAVS